MDAKTLDPSDVRFRLRSIRAGVVLSYLCVASFLAYFAFTWERPHRLALAIVLGATLPVTAGMRFLPLEAIVRGRHRELFFLTWSASLVVLIAVAAVLDGGAGSPTAVALFLPLAFAALSYPTRSMIAVGAMVFLGYLTVSIVAGGSHASAFMVASCLCNAAWMCAWQARNHDRWRVELNRVSRADALTGCLNRRGLEERFEAESARATRTGEPLAIVLVDLDDFKQVNDQHGHAAGDELLCWSVRHMARVLRPTDDLGRIGGDEFAAVLPGADREGAEEIAERLRAALAERVACCTGVAVQAADGATPDALHAKADVRLYRAKGGKDSREGATSSRNDMAWAEALACAVDARVSGRHSHSEAVAALSVAIARRLGWADEQVGRLRLAATLHDVGKWSIADDILAKPTALDPAEMAAVRRHPAEGAALIGGIGGLDDIAMWVGASHEHVDGSGYPDGLRGEEIPEASRIILVADAYDAMTSHRAYRNPLPHVMAVEELRRNAGGQFDARCVSALLAHMGEARPLVAAA